VLLPRAEEVARVSRLSCRLLPAGQVCAQFINFAGEPVDLLALRFDYAVDSLLRARPTAERQPPLDPPEPRGPLLPANRLEGPLQAGLPSISFVQPTPRNPGRVRAVGDTPSAGTRRSVSYSRTKLVAGSRRVVCYPAACMLAGCRRCECQ